MPFVLLEFAMQSGKPASPIGPDLSEASESRSGVPPEMSDQHLQGSMAETRCALEATASARRRIRPGEVARGKTKNRIDELCSDS